LGLHLAEYLRQTGVVVLLARGAGMDLLLYAVLIIGELDSLLSLARYSLIGVSQYQATTHGRVATLLLK